MEVFGGQFCICVYNQTSSDMLYIVLFATMQIKAADFHAGVKAIHVLLHNVLSD